MNGRIYDPLLGRFLSADLMVPHPGSLQSYNRYSYVQNNPLTLVDPSGFAEQTSSAGLDTLNRICAEREERAKYDRMGAAEHWAHVFEENYLMDREDQAAALARQGQDDWLVNGPVGSGMDVECLAAAAIAGTSLEAFYTPNERKLDSPAKHSVHREGFGYAKDKKMPPCAVVLIQTLERYFHRTVRSQKEILALAGDTDSRGGLDSKAIKKVLAADKLVMTKHPVNSTAEFVAYTSNRPILAFRNEIPTEDENHNVDMEKHWFAGIPHPGSKTGEYDLNNYKGNGQTATETPSQMMSPKGDGPWHGAAGDSNWIFEISE